MPTSLKSTCLFLLLFFAGHAIASDVNVIEQFRSLKATKISQLRQDVNNTEKELERCIRAPIKSSQEGKEKRAAIDALRAKIRTLQSNIVRAETNDVNIIVEPFRLPFQVGQIGRIGDVIYGGYKQEFTHEQRFKIISIINDRESLVEFEISSHFARFNNLGMGVGRSEVMTKNVWLRGISTDGLITGSFIRPSGLFVITGTHDYETVLGDKQTVYVFEPLKIPADAL